MGFQVSEFAIFVSRRSRGAAGREKQPKAAECFLSRVSVAVCEQSLGGADEVQGWEHSLRFAIHQERLAGPRKCRKIDIDI